MRNLLPVILGAVLALGLLPASASGAAKLVVSAATEPPDTQARGGKFRATVTVANEGDRRSSRDTLRFYLSRGRRFSADDLQRRLGGTTRISRLGKESQTTRRITIRIPLSIADGVYYLVTCLGRAGTGTDNLNCRFSGQTMEIGRRVVTPQPGPQGPAGPAGPPGPGADLHQIKRTTLQAGTNTIDAGESFAGDSADNGDELEGSTQETDLVTVGPFKFRALCRNEGSDNGVEDEAKILVYTDGGTMNFQGDMGPRYDIPAGPGTAGLGPANDGVDGGEGKHQIIVANRPTLPFDDPEEGKRGGFHASTVVLTHSDGTLVTFTGYAGIDTLGIGTPGDDAGGPADECVFGGTVVVL